jgi:hypothetical protein
MCKFTLHLCQLNEQNKPLVDAELRPQFGRFWAFLGSFFDLSQTALGIRSRSAGVPGDDRLHHRFENLLAVRAAQARVAGSVRVRH